MERKGTGEGKEESREGKRRQRIEERGDDRSGKHIEDTEEKE